MPKESWNKGKSVKKSKDYYAKILNDAFKKMQPNNRKIRSTEDLVNKVNIDEAAQRKAPAKQPVPAKKNTRSDNEKRDANRKNAADRQEREPRDTSASKVPVNQRKSGNGDNGYSQSARNRQKAQGKDKNPQMKGPGANPDTVKRVGQVIQGGIKDVAKGAADPVGTIKKGAQTVGKAVSDLADTAKKNGYGPKTTATIKKEPAKEGPKTAKITSTLKVKEEKKPKKEKAQKQQTAQVKAESVSGRFDPIEAMKARRAAAEAAGKGKFNAIEEMKKRRAAAEAAGKGKFNATEEMKKRRAAAEAQGKGKWNAQEEMRKRREEAAKRKIQKGFNGK